MKGFLLHCLSISLFVSLFIGLNVAMAPVVDDDIKPVIEEVEQTLVHYRAWLESPETKNVVQGTNHAARATAFIDAYLAQQAREVPGLDDTEQPVGLRGIQSLLLKQMRIHVDLLSTNVPVGIVEYNSDVENALEEQLNLLEKTLREFERHQRRG